MPATRIGGGLRAQRSRPEAARASPARSKRELRPAEASRAALRTVGSALARHAELAPEDALLAAVGSLDAAAVQGLLRRADGGLAAPKRLEGAPWSKALRKLEAGDAAEIPALAVRPGQTQLSFDHAAEKLGKIAKSILAGKAKTLGDLFDDDDFPVIIAPGGGFAVLRDGHHKLAGLLALSALVHDVLGTGKQASSQTALGVGGAWKTLAELLPPPGELALPVLVEASEAQLAKGEKDRRRLDDFFSLFDAPGRFDPPLHLQRRDGSTAARPPERMSKLEDNPFRRLAAELVAKLEWKDGEPKLQKNEAPLWLKGPDAPEYVEFPVAEVLETTAEAIGFDYAPGQPVPDEVQDAFRRGFVEARRAGHPVLQKVISFEHDIDLEALGRTFALTRHAVLDFGRDAKKPDPGDIPVVLLPSDAPDVHRLHVAARLHAALTEAGAALDVDALDADVARAAIERLAHVHDEVGLWVNETCLTRSELERGASLARSLAARLEPKKKTKLGLAEPPAVEAPAWVELPGLPASAAYAVAAACAELFAEVDHDPERLDEIAERARARLVEAKTNPQDPFYERLAQVPVVVSGASETVAASLRVGRKKRILELGREVKGAAVPPHVLGPRARLAVS